MIARCGSERLHFKAAVSANKTGVIFSESFIVHSNYLLVRSLLSDAEMMEYIIHDLLGNAPSVKLAKLAQSFLKLKIDHIRGHP